MPVRISFRRTVAVRLATAVVAIAAFTAACDTQPSGTTSPTLPGNPSPNPQIKSAAFIADVNLTTRKITISAPVTNVTPGASAGAAGVAAAKTASLDLQAGGPSYSILAGDVVELTASNMVTSAVGQYTPGKQRVTFDINITNRLASVQLITPTFPTPPAGVTGVFLFPYENVVTVTTGSIGVGGDGTDVIVETPSYGLIEPSITWDGAPHNFFNDTGCPAGSNDCYRYEAFAQPLAAGATSAARSVGFDIDPTVHSFRARLIVAADLQNSGAAPTGTVAGTVSSPQRGALSGVTVTVNSGGFTGTTGAGGAYSIASVTTGPKTVSLSGLPSGCTDPGSQATTVTSGGTSTVNFTVTCTVPSGTIGGTVSSSLGGGLNGVGVSATPTGGSLVGPAFTNASGVYSLASVPVGGAGTGNLSLTNLPGNCTNPGAIPYSGLTSGGTITVNVTVSCTAPPAGYQFTATWGPISGGQVVLTLRIDMSTYNDAAIPGADDIEAVQGQVTYSGTRLQFVSAANVAGSGLTNAVSNGATPGVVQWGNFTTNPTVTTQQGLQGLIAITFNVLAGAPQSVSTVNTFSAAESRNGTNLIPRIIVTEGTLSIP
jgi:hypothetical protein